MVPQSWLPITEYAGKYRVSISTLRRRIKAGDVEYSFKEGKYLLKDSPISLQPPPSPNPSATVAPPHNFGSSGQMGSLKVAEADADGPILATANRLLGELKKAYSLILQEKEEQILLLKEEAVDLRTLVRVLETENERLRKGSGFEPWVD